MPKISVFITSYNYGEYIEQAIQSVLAQTYQDFEVIIIDNASTDNSIEIIEKYTKISPKIHLYQHPDGKNHGLIASIKLGIEKAKGDYIAFVEADDFIEKTNFEKKMNIFEKYSEVNFVFNNFEYIGDSNRITTLKNHYDFLQELFSTFNNPFDYSPYIGALNIVVTLSSVMMKKEVLSRCNLDSPIEPHIDIWLYPQIAQYGKAFCLNEKLTTFRQHQKSATAITRSQISREQSKNLLFELFKILKQNNPEKYNETLLESILEKLILFKTIILKSKKEELLQKIKNKKIYLYGAGLFAKEVLESFDFSGVNICGFIDTNYQKCGQKLGEYEIFHINQIECLNPEILLLCVSEPELLYYSLECLIAEKNLSTKIIPNMFEEIKYSKIIKNKNLKLEEIVADIIV